jgi:ribosomal protein S1
MSFRWAIPIDVKILKINAQGIAQNLAGIEAVAARSVVAGAGEISEQGSRVKGKVARVADFGAFVELEPGIEGLIHVSEMSWTKKNVRARTS